MRVAAILSLIMVLASIGGTTAASAQGTDRGLTSPPFYIDRDARFGVMFPGEPTVDDIEYATEAGLHFPARQYSIVQGSNEYRVTFVDFSAGPAADPVIVENAVNELVRQGELIYQATAEYEPGVESSQLMVSLGDGNEIQASVYMWEHRLVMTEATGAPGTPSILRFVQSITLLEADGSVM